MTIEYGTPGPPTVTRHDYIYTTLLGVLGFFFLISIPTMYGLAHAPSTPPETRWIFMGMAVTELLYALAVVAVGVIRIWFPDHRRWPTVAVNVLLLLYFPLGTALAIYGFWKVDKKLPPSVVSE
jgi:hypothetical protein